MLREGERMKPPTSLPSAAVSDELNSKGGQSTPRRQQTGFRSQDEKTRDAKMNYFYLPSGAKFSHASLVH